MPAISIDTFFACSLMVILVLSAMACTSKILYPHMNNVDEANFAEFYRGISRHILLNEGEPSNWGQNSQAIPEVFGLARTDAEYPYDLDIDKVSRLNEDNIYALSYAQIFTILKMPDITIRVEVEPIFEVTITQTATYESTNEITYQFDIGTEKNGAPIKTELKYYVAAENYLNPSAVHYSDGKTSLNVTLSKDVNGPALLVVLAKSSCNTKIVSFGVYAFAHNSLEPEPNSTFLRLSPLNYSLDASFKASEISLSKVYALTFNYSSTLTQTSINNQSATYEIPHFLDSSPTLIVATGWNSTKFFAEWTAYPQIPLQTGANFTSAMSLSDAFAYTYIVTIDSALYKCTIWLGGPRE